jgi:hypothetical protein
LYLSPDGDLLLPKQVVYDGLEKRKVGLNFCYNEFFGLGI